MFRRRRPAAEPAQDEMVDGGGPAENETASAGGDEPAGAEASADDVAPKSERPDGPYDLDEVDADAIAASHLDFGGMRIRAMDGMKLQFQVDKRTGRASSVLISEGDAAVQLVAVAAPRSSGLWDRTRLEIAADARRRDGSADEAKGPFGTELRVVVPVSRPDGSTAVQPSRVSGIDGPRWMLRATFLGQAITDAGAFARLVEAVRAVVVVRGSDPKAPGEVITLNPPAGADDESEATEQTDDGPTPEAT